MKKQYVDSITVAEMRIARWMSGNEKRKDKE